MIQWNENVNTTDFDCICRSNYLEVCYKKGVLKKIVKLTGKQLRRRTLLAKLSQVWFVTSPRKSVTASVFASIL